jgi:phosphatidylinositol alpha-1,6-mannosyltransferase
VSILLLTEVFPPRQGGSGRWLWELYRRLPLPVEVVTAEVAGGREFDRSAGMPITRVPLTFPSWGVLSPAGLVAYWRTFRRLAKVVRRLRPASIHCGKALPEGLLGLLGARRWRIPYVCFVHGEELRLAHTSRDLTWLTRLVLRRASTIVANSAHTETILRREWRVADRIVVMHPGVDTSRFVPAPPDEVRRAALGWTGRRVVLTVGALQKRKGQDMLIRALPAIQAACPDVLYVMAGEGWERSSLEQLADELGVRGAVRFMDVPSDDVLIGCYQQCDLFALPNRQVGWDIEGFGIVLLEAQACGKPVIAGRSGGTLETLQPGVTGELVTCETPEPLAEAVIALLNDPERSRAMGAAGRTWTTARFDWAVLSEQARKVFAAAGRTR